MSPRTRRDINVFGSRRRDALSDLALHFLNKMKIMVVKDIEREDIEFICKVIRQQRSLSHHLLRLRSSQLRTVARNQSGDVLIDRFGSEFDVLFCKI